MEWKNINLFDVIPSGNELENKLKCIKSEVTAYSCNSRFNIFCDKLGYVHILGTSWEKPWSFRANNKSIIFCAVSEELNLLVIIVQSQTKNEIIVQVFNVTDPKSIGNISLSLSKTILTTSSSVCCLQTTVNNHNFIIVIGCENGDLYYHQSPVGSNLVFRCFNINKKPIRAMEFVRNSLFACTDADVFSITINESNILESKSVLLKEADVNKSKYECACVGLLRSHAEPYLFVGRTDAIYCFTPDDRGPCYAFEGSKESLALYKNYLVIIVTKDYESFAQNSSKKTLMVLDIQNKLIVLEKTIEGVAGILSNESKCYIFTNSKEIFMLQEYDLQTKVQLLLKKGLFDIALRVTDVETCDEEIRANIFLKYGDYFMSKGNWDLAMQQYIKTLGILDPYIIIYKLLNPRLNSYLCYFLEALLKTGNAKQRHKKLLLKCNERFNIFTNVETYLDEGELPQYSLIIPKDVRHDEKSVMDISYKALTNIIESDASVLKFFSSMEEENIYIFFAKYGERLFKKYPNKILDILKELCSTDHRLIKSPERFIPLLLEHNSLCITFLEHIVKSGYYFNRSIYNVLLELHLQTKLNAETSNDKLLRFLNDHLDQLNITHAFMTCKLYTFFPGIRILTKKWLEKNSVEFDSCWPEMHLTTDNVTGLKPFLPINSSHKNTLQLNFNFFLEKTQYSRKRQLEIMDYLFRHETVAVGEILDIFNQENFSKMSNFKFDKENVFQFLKQEKLLNDVLQNYLLKPVEFRSNVCNICRQEIYLPAKFYLCKHVFHKDCAQSYTLSDSCPLCSSLHNRTLDQQKPTLLQESENFSFQKIANLLAKRTMGQEIRNYVKCSYASHQTIMVLPSKQQYSMPMEDFNAENTNPFECSPTNPFECSPICLK